MQKTYIRRNWQNYPSVQTPLNETNLNAMDYSLDEVDSRVIALDTTKLDLTTANNLIQSVSLNETTGVMTFTKLNGSTFTIQTAVGKIAVNFDYDVNTQQLILHHQDGTTLSIDLSALVNQTEFDNSETIGFSVTSNGHIVANIIDGSIKDTMLRPDYLADIRVVQATAEANQAAAKTSELESEAWAVGTKEGEAVRSRDAQYENNSKYYSDIASANCTEAIAKVDEARTLLDQANRRLSSMTMWTDMEDGHLYYETQNGMTLSINLSTGHMMYEVNA